MFKPWKFNSNFCSIFKFYPPSSLIRTQTSNFSIFDWLSSLWSNNWRIIVIILQALVHDLNIDCFECFEAYFLAASVLQLLSFLLQIILSIDLRALYIAFSNLSWTFSLSFCQFRVLPQYLLLHLLEYSHSINFALDVFWEWLSLEVKVLAEDLVGCHEYLLLRLDSFQEYLVLA